MKEKGKLIESPEVCTKKPSECGNWYCKVKGECWEKGGLREAESPRQPSELDKELGRWQKAIYELCKKAVGTDGDFIIDGGGCDSGDALDFTLTEIGQAFSYLREVSQHPVPAPKGNRSQLVGDEKSGVYRLTGILLDAGADLTIMQDAFEEVRQCTLNAYSAKGEHPVPAPETSHRTWTEVKAEMDSKGGHPEPAKGGTE